jgi:hypothetical protein
MQQSRDIPSIYDEADVIDQYSEVQSAQTNSNFTKSIVVAPVQVDVMDDGDASSFHSIVVIEISDDESEGGAMEDGRWSPRRSPRGSPRNSPRRSPRGSPRTGPGTSDSVKQALERRSSKRSYDETMSEQSADVNDAASFIVLETRVEQARSSYFPDEQPSKKPEDVSEQAAALSKSLRDSRVASSNGSMDMRLSMYTRKLSSVSKQSRGGLDSLYDGEIEGKESPYIGSFMMRASTAPTWKLDETTERESVYDEERFGL